MGYTNDKEQARADRAAAIRHKKSILSRLDYSSIFNEVDDIASECSDMAYFDDEEVSEMLNYDGEGDNEFRIIAQELLAEARMLCSRMYSGDWQITCDGYKIEDVFDDVMVAMAAREEKRWGYDEYLDEFCELDDFECSLAKETAKKRLSRYTKEQLFNIFSECFQLTLRWLDITQGFDYLNATLGVVKSDQKAILDAVKRINDAYERAAERKASGFDDDFFDNMTEDLPVEVWVI